MSRLNEHLEMLTERLGAAGNITPRNGFSRIEVQRASDAIHAVGIPAQLQQWEAEDRQDTRGGGRPADFTMHHWCILMLLLCGEGSPLFVKLAAAIIDSRLGRNTRAHFGFNTRAGNNTYASLRRAGERIHRILDATPTGDRRRRLSRDEWEQVVADRENNAAVLEQRRERLDWFTNAVLQASLLYLPEKYRTWDGSVTLDATPVLAYGPDRSRRSSRVSIEPDAGWYVRSGKHKYDADRKSSGGNKKHFYGWELELALLLPRSPYGAAPCPALVGAISMHKPGVNSAGHAIEALTHLREFGLPAGYLVTDRLYAPGSKPERFQDPARALGYDLVFDYRNDQLGVMDSYNGALLIEGNLYSPSIPPPLVNATRDWRAGVIDDDVYRARIAQRLAYAFRAKARPNEAGAVAYQCPAAGPNATVACPRKPNPTATEAALDAGRMLLPVRPVGGRETWDAPGMVCSAKNSTTVPANFGSKFRQNLQYQGIGWRKLFAPARNEMEGVNGSFKDLGHADPRRRRMRGFTAQYMLSTFLIAGANVRRINSFLAEHEPVAASAELEDSDVLDELVNIIRDVDPERLMEPRPPPQASPTL